MFGILGHLLYSLEATQMCRLNRFFFMGKHIMRFFHYTEPSIITPLDFDEFNTCNVERDVKYQGPVVQSSLVVKMLTVLVNSVSNSQVFLLNDQSFNDMLTNEIISFEKLGPSCHHEVHHSSCITVHIQ